MAGRVVLRSGGVGVISDLEPNASAARVLLGLGCLPAHPTQ